MRQVEQHKQGWLAVAIVLSGFLTLYNSVALNLALPAFQAQFDCSLVLVQWIMIGYTLAMGVLSPTAGYFADRYSCKVLYSGAMAAFGVMAVLAGLSQNIGQIIVIRLLQGACAAFMVPCALMVIYQFLPKSKRATYLSLQSMSLALGPAIGPVLAGFLLDVGHWSWLLYLNVPLAAITAGIIWWALPLEKAANKAPFDWFGLGLVIVGTVLIMISFNLAGFFGFDSWIFWLTLIIGVVSMVLFVKRELKSRWPILNFSVLKYPAYAFCLGINSFVSMALCLAPFVLSIYFQSVLGISPWVSGLLLLVPSLVAMAMFPLAQWIYGRTTGKVLIVASCLLIAVGNGFLGRLTMETGMVYVLFWLCIRYSGIGLSGMPITDFGMRSLPEELTGHGSSFLNWCKMIATSMSLCIFTLILSSRTISYAVIHEPLQAELMAINDVFGYSTLLMLVAVLLGLKLKKK